MAEEVPRELRLVRAFVNTRDIEAGEDELRSPDGLRRWLARNDLVAAGDAVGEDDLEAALALREALRSLLRAHHGEALEKPTVDEVNALAARAPLCVRFDADGGSHLESAERGVPGALGRLLGDVAVAMQTGSWERLKACSRATCGWVFYDRSKNRSGRWCEMRVCGNRTKTRAYRERRRRERA